MPDLTGPRFESQTFSSIDERVLLLNQLPGNSNGIGIKQKPKILAAKTDYLNLNGISVKQGVAVASTSLVFFYLLVPESQNQSFSCVI